MIKLIIFLAGFVSGILCQQIRNCMHNKQEELSLDYGFSRNCLNCKHAIPCMGKDGIIHTYCKRNVDEGIKAYPVEKYNCCGHFSFTDEIRETQTRLSAERQLRKESKIGEKV